MKKAQPIPPRHREPENTGPILDGRRISEVKSPAEPAFDLGFDEE